MKQVLIVLRGALASGKTTIAEQLRDFDNRIVWFKTDNIKPFFSDDRDEAIDAVMETSLAALQHLVDKGYSVVFEGIFKNPIYAKKALEIGRKKGITSVAYQLHCSLAALQSRDRTRKGVKEGCREPLGDAAIKVLFDMLKNSKVENAVYLDTENKSLQACLTVIRKHFE